VGGSSYQEWYLDGGIVNAGSGLALSDPGYSDENGAYVDLESLYAIDGAYELTENQYWNF
jgi:hypothetical protein